jgi:exonuclease 1
MVAPYESDSQIAKLVKLGFADFAITEDSDLVAYGVRVVLKMAQDGDCDYIDLNLWSPTDVDSLFLQQFLQLDHVGRLEAAILSGTDYNGSVSGIGIKRATKLVHRLKSMANVITHLREVKPYCDRVPENYDKQVLDSKIIFLLATTYNPNTNQIEYLNNEYLEQFLPIMSEQEIQEVVGPRYDYTVEHRTGRLNWKTLEKR